MAPTPRGRLAAATSPTSAGHAAVPNNRASGGRCLRNARYCNCNHRHRSTGATARLADDLDQSSTAFLQAGPLSPGVTSIHGPEPRMSHQQGRAPQQRRSDFYLRSSRAWPFPRGRERQAGFVFSSARDRGGSRTRCDGSVPQSAVASGAPHPDPSSAVSVVGWLGPRSRSTAGPRS